MLRFLKRNSTLLATGNSDQMHDEVKRGDVILQIPHLKENVVGIKQQLSVTEEKYRQDYYALMCNVAHYFQHLPGANVLIFNQAYGALHFTLACTLNALKRRRGFLLPIGEVTEVHYLERDHWTYAVFTASMLLNIFSPLHFDIDVVDKKTNQLTRWDPLVSCYLPENAWIQVHESIENKPLRHKALIQAFLIKDLMPANGFIYLQQYAHIFDSWLAFLTNTDQENKDNPIATIFNEAESYVLDVSSSEADRTEINQQDKDKKLHDNDLSMTEDNVSLTTEQVSTENAVFHAFIAWLKEKIQKKLIAINNSQGLLHRVEQGMLIVMPETFAQFIEENLQFEDYEETDYLDVFGDSTQLIKNKNNDLLHEYYLGEWEQQEIIYGLMVDPYLLFEEDTLPDINLDCHPEFDVD